MNTNVTWIFTMIKEARLVKYLLLVLVVLVGAYAQAAAFAAEKPASPVDYTQLRLFDAETRVVQERAGRMVAERRAMLLQMQMKDGAIGCELSIEKVAIWICPDLPKPAAEPVKGSEKKDVAP